MQNVGITVNVSSFAQAFVCDDRKGKNGLTLRYSSTYLLLLKFWVLAIPRKLALCLLYLSVSPLADKNAFLLFRDNNRRRFDLI